MPTHNHNDTVLQKLRNRFQRLLISEAYLYRTLLYACTVSLASVALAAKFIEFDSIPYILTFAFMSVYVLGKLGRLPNYTRKIVIDPLTGLLNRDGFIDRVDQAILSYPTQSVRAPIVVFIVDLTNFKNFNKSLGYKLSDKILSLVAQKISSITSGRDVVARIGVDEFGILITSASIGYMTISERLYAALSEPSVLTPDISVTVGAASGVALYPDHGTNSLEILRSASIALAHSKRTRSRCVVFEPQMDIEREDLSLANEFKRAVEHTEFTFHYQPKLSLKTGRICGVEALIRWKHPTQGLISPDRFIALAEQSDQINLITAWSLREGIRMLSQLKSHNYEGTLSINISPYAIVNSDVLVSLTKEIVYHSIPYKSLIIEVTESSITQSPEDMAKIIACLEMLGIQISIDDFGVGHAPLLYLKHLPLKEIKVDKAFVTNMLTDASDRAIVHSTIDLAHSLGCEVVAEGVETPEVMEALRDLGCDIIQGYLVSKPLIESEFLSFLEAKNGSTS